MTHIVGELGAGERTVCIVTGRFEITHGLTASDVTRQLGTMGLTDVTVVPDPSEALGGISVGTGTAEYAVDPERNDWVSADVDQVLKRSPSLVRPSTAVALSTALRRNGISSIRDLLVIGAASVNNMRNFGPKGMAALRDYLGQYGTVWQQEPANLATIVRLCPTIHDVPFGALVADFPDRSIIDFMSVGAVMQMTTAELAALYNDAKRYVGAPLYKGDLPPDTLSMPAREFITHVRHVTQSFGVLYVSAQAARAGR